MAKKGLPHEKRRHFGVSTVVLAVVTVLSVLAAVMLAFDPLG